MYPRHMPGIAQTFSICTDPVKLAETGFIKMKHRECNYDLVHINSYGCK